MGGNSHLSKYLGWVQSISAISFVLSLLIHILLLLLYTRVIVLTADFVELVEQAGIVSVTVALIVLSIAVLASTWFSLSSIESSLEKVLSYKDRQRSVPWFFSSFFTLFFSYWVVWLLAGRFFQETLTLTEDQYSTLFASLVISLLHGLVLQKSCAVVEVKKQVVNLSDEEALELLRTKQYEYAKLHGSTSRVSYFAAYFGLFIIGPLILILIAKCYGEKAIHHLILLVPFFCMVACRFFSEYFLKKKLF
jgi:hypothetical protein